MNARIMLRRRGARLKRGFQPNSPAPHIALLRLFVRDPRKDTTAMGACLRDLFPPGTYLPECLAGPPHDEDWRLALGSRMKLDDPRRVHHPQFARPKPYVVKDRKTGANPTQADIDEKRADFWANAPSQGGDREIWDTLKRAAEAMTGKWMHPTKWTHGKPWKRPGDLKRARLEVAQSRADIAVAKPDMTLCIDQNKFAYRLPRWVLRDPTNLQVKEEANHLTYDLILEAKRTGRTAVNDDEAFEDAEEGELRDGEGELPDVPGASLPEIDPAQVRPRMLSARPRPKGKPRLGLMMSDSM